MTELEHALVALGADLDVPATPPLVARVRERIARRRRARRGLVLGVALAVVALGIAFAVPQARTSILRFFHIGAVTVERVSKLPPAQRRIFTTALGPVRSRGDAERVARFHARLGSLAAPAQWWAERGALATVLPNGVLLVEFAGNQLEVTKKFAQGNVAPTDVRGSFALWIPGRHVLLYRSPSRGFQSVLVSGTALIWVRDGITYRLEGEPDLGTARHDGARLTP